MFEVDAAAIERAAALEVTTLRALGVAEGDAVGWLALNQPRALALVRACECLGARYVPLNGRLAAPELAAIVRHAGLQQLLHDDAMASLARQVLALVAMPQPRAPGHVPGDLLLVYTSGTTGLARGAVHTAAAVQANTLAAIDAQALSVSTRTLAVLPLFHVGGLGIQVLPTLAAGGVVLLHRRFDAGAWLRDVASWRPTTSLLVPAAMSALIEHPAWPTTDLTSLAFINTGSSIVPRPLIDAFHAQKRSKGDAEIAELVCFQCSIINRASEGGNDDAQADVRGVVAKEGIELVGTLGFQPERFLLQVG